ncbi:MAG: hypothetical protein OXE99_09920 [Cellvibrionales bacterium]|nr:hypothetical protein [Cellvibrionales bacterium]
MSEIKTEALGFLHVLATDEDLRQGWLMSSDWPRFFDDLDHKSSVTQALDSIGVFKGDSDSSGEDKEKNIACWKTVAENVIDMFTKQMANPEDRVQDQEVFDEIPDGLPSYPQLALLLAVLAYNAQERASFLSDPEGYLNKLPDAYGSIPDLDGDLKGLLVLFAKGEPLGKEKEAIIDLMAKQYFVEQEHIW